jgi:hypothetical protein
MMKHLGSSQPKAALPGPSAIFLETSGWTKAQSKASRGHRGMANRATLARLPGPDPDSALHNHGQV